jgi:hypothetical protein
MKNIDKTPVKTNEETPTIDTALLGGVTGGCAACGQPGVVHQSKSGSPFGAFAALMR